jgi:hypothetical protein
MGVEIGGFEYRVRGIGFCMWEAVQEARALLTE